MKRIITDLVKNRRERIRIALDEYEGRQLVSVRTWYFDDNGALKPTPKGLSVDIRHLSALRQALHEAERVAREHNLISPSESS